MNVKIAVLCSISAIIYGGVTGFGVFTVTPPRIEFEGIPGETCIGTFTVINLGDTEEEIQISLFDWTIDTEGIIQQKPPGTLERSLCPWVILSDWQFKLSPRESKDVEVRLEIPDDPAEGSHWGMVVVSGNPVPIEAEGGQFIMRVNVTYGVCLYYTNPVSVTRAGIISDVSLSSDSEDGHAIRFAFKNTGNTVLRPQGYILIRDASGADVCEINVDEFFVLPGGICKVTEKIEEDLPEGNYLAIVVIDYGGENLVAGQRVFEIGGPP